MKTEAELVAISGSFQWQAVGQILYDHVVERLLFRANPHCERRRKAEELIAMIRELKEPPSTRGRSSMG